VSGAELRWRSLTARVLSRAAAQGERPSITWVRDGGVHSLSGRELDEHVRALLLGLDGLGLEKGERIGILSPNRWEWVLIDLAATGRGLAVVSIDPAWSDNLVVRILDHARVRCVFVESAASARRLEGLADRLPHVRAIASIEDDLTALVARGRESLATNPARVEQLLAAVQPDDIATVIHTGGSTGEPKGVLRSHGNAVSEGWALFPWRDDLADPTPGDEATVFDPLSFCHSAGRWWCHMTLAVRGILALPSGDALDLAELELLRPTRIVGVPRVVLQLQKLLMPHVQEQWTELENLAPGDAARPALAAAFAARVRSLVGGRLQCIFWGGGPLASALIAFFQTAGIRMISGYGGTEIGIISMRAIDSPPATVGKPVGAAVRIEAGEILVRGPAVSPGYLDNPKATALAQAADGWWRSGDLGRLDEAGNLVIVGRVRAMFTCSEGTNIDPSELEQLLEADPYVSQAILLGHNRPHLAALISPDRERLSAAGVVDAAALIAERLALINRGLEEFERIRAFRLIEGTISEGIREITVAKKIRVDRQAVERVYADEIAAMYRA